VKNWFRNELESKHKKYIYTITTSNPFQKIRGYDIMVKPEHIKAHETKSHDEKAQKPKEKQQKPKK
jgi:hypothetical protein